MTNFIQIPGFQQGNVEYTFILNEGNVACFICYRINIIIKANYIQQNDISRNISMSAPQRTETEI